MKRHAGYYLGTWRKTGSHLHTSIDRPSLRLCGGLLLNPFIRIEKLFVLILSKAVCHSGDIVAYTPCYWPASSIHRWYSAGYNGLGFLIKGDKKFFQEPLCLIWHPWVIGIGGYWVTTGLLTIFTWYVYWWNHDKTGKNSIWRGFYHVMNRGNRRHFSRYSWSRKFLWNSW